MDTASGCQNNKSFAVDYLFHWARGQRFFQDVRVLTVPPEMPQGKAYFEVGLFRSSPVISDPTDKTASILLTSTVRQWVIASISVRSWWARHRSKPSSLACVRWTLALRSGLSLPAGRQ